MNREKYRELFDAYIDGELEEGPAQEFLAYLETDVRLNLEFKVFRAMIESIERADVVEMPEDLNSIVMRGVNAEPTPWNGTLNPEVVSSIRSSSIWGWSFAFAGALFLFSATFLGPSAPTRLAQIPEPPMNAGTSLPPVLLPDVDAVRTSLEDRAIIHRVQSGDSNIRVEDIPAPVLNRGEELALVAHSGRVEILELGSSEWRSVEGRQTISFGTRIRTSENGVGGLEFPGFVSLRVKPDSLVQVVSESELRLYRGNTWVMVRKKGRAFSVETPNAIASVRGTRFSVQTQGMSAPYRDGLLSGLGVFGSRSLTNLTVPGPQAGLAVLAQLLQVSPLRDLQSQVQVYESSVWTSARLEDGRFSEARIVSEGFGSQVLGSQVDVPVVLAASDFFAHQGYMVYDPTVLQRARDSLQIPMPGTANIGSSVIDEPTSTSTGGPLGDDYDDLNQAH